MNSRSYKNSQLKHKLHQMRNAKKKNPKWKLNPDDLEYIQRIGFPVKTYLYVIKTKRILNLQEAPGIVKHIHYSCVKEHKSRIFKPLNKKERAQLDRYDIAYSPYNHEILLNEYVGK